MCETGKGLWAGGKQSVTRASFGICRVHYSQHIFIAPFYATLQLQCQGRGLSQAQRPSAGTISKQECVATAAKNTFASLSSAAASTLCTLLCTGQLSSMSSLLQAEQHVWMLKLDMVACNSSRRHSGFSHHMQCRQAGIFAQRLMHSDALAPGMQQRMAKMRYRCSDQATAGLLLARPNMSLPAHSLRSSFTTCTGLSHLHVPGSPELVPHT